MCRARPKLRKLVEDSTSLRTHRRRPKMDCQGDCATQLHPRQKRTYQKSPTPHPSEREHVAASWRRQTGTSQSAANTTARQSRDSATRGEGRRVNLRRTTQALGEERGDREPTPTEAKRGTGEGQQKANLESRKCTYGARRMSTVRRPVSVHRTPTPPSTAQQCARWEKVSTARRPGRAPNDGEPQGRASHAGRGAGAVQPALESVPPDRFQLREGSISLSHNTSPAFQKSGA